MKAVTFFTTIALALGATTLLPSPGRAATAAQISQSAKRALRSLYASNAAAQVVGSKAKAVLVFPNIVKGGFIVAAHHGDGALIANGRTVGYYNTVAASYGLQAGLQTFSYAECDDRCANEQRDHHQSAGDALDRAHYRDLFHGKGKSKDNSTVEITLHRSKIFIVI